MIKYKTATTVTADDSQTDHSPLSNGVLQTSGASAGGATRSVATKSRPSRILIVDDEILLQRSVDRILREAGYETGTAVNGREAMALLDAQSFDAIVSDIDMPEMDGIQLLRAVRERYNDVPIVLMTAVPEPPMAIQALFLGALQYLQKPFYPDDLKKAATRAVQLCRMARAKKEALALVSDGRFGALGRAGLEVNFQRALDSK